MSCRFLISCCLIFLAFGCKNNNDPDIIVNVEDDFYVDMFEDISNGERRLEMRLTSIKEQDCLNYTIDYDLSFNEAANIIELSINALVEPELCVDGNTQTKVSIPFGSLNEGNYAFFLNLKDAVKNTGRLRVISENYHLDLDSDDGIELTNERLIRIPEQTIWGAIVFENDGQSDEAASFIAELENINYVYSVEEDASYPSGYYGYFELDEQKNISLLEEQPTEEHFLPFIFNYDGADLSSLNDLLETTCNQYPAWEIELRLANGQILTCD